MVKITSLYDFFTKESSHELKEGYFFINSIKSRKNSETKKNHVLTVTDGEYVVKTFLKDSAIDQFRENFDLRKGAYIYAENVNAVIIADRRKFSMAIGKYEILDYDHVLDDNLVMLEEKFDELKKISDIPSYNAHPFDLGGASETPKETTPNQTSINSSATMTKDAPLVKRKLPADRSLMAIELLSSYQNNWAIKARVSFKSDVKTWSNQRGSGSLFNVHFLDETGEIRATGFNDACTKFSELLQEGKVYRVSKARLKQANHKFSTLKHSYEIQLENDTQIEECVGDEQEGNVPQVKYELVTLDALKTMEALPNNQPGGELDVLGIINKVDTAFQITSKAGKTYDRRNITIVDESLTAVNINLWNKPALEFNIPVGSVVVCKGCKLTDFRGKSLSMTPGGRIVESPDLKEAYKLKGWFNDVGKSASFDNISEEGGNLSSLNNEEIDISKRIPFNKLINENVGMQDTPEYVTLKGFIGKIKQQNFFYEACATPDCLKKVTNIGDAYSCEKCEKTHDTCLKRYTLNMQLIDPYDSIWVSCFNDVAEKLLGHTADELADDPKLAETVFNEKNMEPFNFRLRASKREYGGVERVNYSIMTLSKVNFNKEVDYVADLLLNL
ncbi:hypothetical protein QEN19_001648 [Hanseniaspora menglaensis]